MRVRSRANAVADADHGPHHHHHHHHRRAPELTPTQKTPGSLRSGGLLCWVSSAVQALGLRPWLAALPLRERRLRARLLMSAPNKMGIVNSPCGHDSRHSDKIPAIMAYKAVGGPPGRAKPRTMAIGSKSAQTDDVDCNRHAAFANEIA